MNKRIAGFFHVFANAENHPHWAHVLYECASAVYFSGLYDRCDTIYVGINSPGGYGINGIQDFLSLYPKFKITRINNSSKSAEWTTLSVVKEMVNEYDYCFYIHTKNASYNTNKHNNNFHNRELWRRVMLNQIIKEWKACESLLWQNDAVGCSWQCNNHFQGNFWWATSEYINKLPHPHDLLTNPKVKAEYLNDAVAGWSLAPNAPGITFEKWEYEVYRFVCETWISFGKPKVFDKLPIPLFDNNELIKYI